MTSEQWREVGRHFDTALETAPHLRDAYLATIAPQSTRSEVERLLGAMSQAEPFLEEPAVSRDWLLAEHFGQSLQPGQVLLNRFEVLARLGAGGMGEVYAADDRRLGEKVAIKTILPALSEQQTYIEMFRSEVKRARQITHPNVCRIHDLFEVPGDQPLVFFTMELVPGISLARRLDENGAYSPAEALPLVMQIANGLDAAHAADLIHRDLKPGNILISDDGRAVITDFGLAQPNTGAPLPASATRGGRSLDDTRTQASRATGGTVRYFAPEQLNGSPASRATDIYAFGLVVYQLITAAFPFEATDALVEVTKRLTSKPTAPSLRLPQLPPGWDQAVLWCLRARPEERPRSAGEAIALLQGNASFERLRARLPHVGRRAVFRLAGVGAVVAAGTLLLRNGPHAPVTTPGSEKWMVIAEPTGPSDQPHLASALRQSLMTALENAPRFAAYPAWRVKSALALMGVAPKEPLTEARARAVAQRDGLLTAGVGEAQLLGDQVRLSFRVVDAATGDVRAQAVEMAGTEAELTRAADRLVRSIRRQVGELESSVSATPDLAKVTTASFMALARFSDGLRYYEEGRTDQALTLLKSAGEIDPQFAMAFEYQALVHSAAGEEHLGFPLAERAFALRDRATERERLQIAAMYEIFKGNYEKGLEGYRALVAVYPDDPRLLRQLAHHYSMAGRTQEATQTAAQSAALDGRPLAQAAYALVLAQSGDARRAREVTRAATHQGVDPRLLDWADGVAEMVEGRGREAEACFRRFGSLIGQHSHAMLYVADAMLLAGKLSEAVEELEASLPAVLLRREFLSEIRHRHLAGLLSRRLNRRAVSTGHAETLAKLGAEPWNLDALRFGVHLAYELADRVRLEVCATKLQAIAQRFPGTRSQGFSAEARGLLALLKDQPVEARRFARQAAELWPDCWSQWCLGRILSATGSHQAAIEPLQKLVGQAGHAFRWNGTLAWVESQLLLARCYREVGNFALAAQHYDLYLKMWQGTAPFHADTRLAAAERAGLRRL